MFVCQFFSIHLIFGCDSWDNKVQYYKRSISFISPKNVSMSLIHVFRQFCNKFKWNFVYNFYLIFWLISSDTTNVHVRLSQELLRFRGSILWMFSFLFKYYLMIFCSVFVCCTFFFIYKIEKKIWKCNVSSVASKSVSYLIILTRPSI